MQPLQVQQDFASSAAGASLTFMPQVNTPAIFIHNARTLIISALLAVASFGTLTLMMLMVPIGLLGFLAAELSHAGTNPALFLTAFILPHGLFELPAAILATAFGLRTGATIISGSRRGENSGFFAAMGDWIKVFVMIVLPLLFLGAVVEVYVTPRIVTYFFAP